METEGKETLAPYSMKIERTIVDDLGLKLYDKVSAVVAEIIANSYDADAEKVIIKLPLGKALATHRGTEIIQSGYCIEVIDDGHGMTPEEANKFYLRVGKHRRDDKEQGEFSKDKKRNVMGRKGLGKLAPFGVCKTIEVRSAGGEKTSKGYLVTHFQLNYDGIISKTDEQEHYYPPPMEDDQIWDEKPGTTIRLKNFLAKRVTDKNTFARQLSYRFGLGTTDFRITVVDTNEENPENPFSIEETEIPTMEGTTIVVDDRPVPTEDGRNLPVLGWMGMAKYPYKNEEFAGVRIYVRGKIASVTRDFGLPAGFEGEFVARSYLVGAIHADWLDDEEDLIQTHRQDILWSSDLGRALAEWGKKIVKEVAKAGREPRRKKVREQFLEVSNFKERAEKRFQDPQLVSTALELGKSIGGFASEDELSDKEYVDNLSEIILSVTPHKLLVDTFKKIQDMAVDGKVNLEDIINLLRTSKIAVLASYGQIVVEKLQTIDILEKNIYATGISEPVFQGILEGAPWLINPAWEPLTTNQSLKNFRISFTAWYKKKYNTDILMTTEIKHSTKIPDFILLNIENALQVVEIKPPEHVYDGKDWERMYRYPTAISKFLEENPTIKESFPNGVITTLIADKINVSGTVSLAMKQWKTEKKLVTKTWTELLNDTKIAHESFLKARELFKEDS